MCIKTPGGVGTCSDTDDWALFLAFFDTICLGMLPERFLSNSIRKNSGVRRMAGEHGSPVTRFLSYSNKKELKSKSNSKEESSKFINVKVHTQGGWRVGLLKRKR